MSLSWKSSTVFGNEPMALSIGQSLSAFCASSLENVSAVRSLHSLSEAMLLLSLTLFGLVCSEHFQHLLEFFIGSVLLFSLFTLLHNDALYYIHKRCRLSRVFLIFIGFFYFFALFDS